MKHDLLLFDLDGTISDPILGIGRSLNYALEHFGYPSLTDDRIATYIGPPLDQAFAAITGNNTDIHLRELVGKYRERYADIGFAENSLYENVAETFASLHAQGTAMAVCTSKRRDFAERILLRFEIAQYFLFVDGGDVGIEKWQQIEALRANGQATSSSLMIGDRAVDLVAARRNQLSCGAVLWGYGDRDELQPHNPHYWFESPSDWLQLI